MMDNHITLIDGENKLMMDNHITLIDGEKK